MSRRLLARVLHIGALAWNRDGTWLAAGDSEGTLRLWRSDGMPGPVLSGHSKFIACVAWSPDGTRLASGGYDRSVRIWSSDGTRGPVLEGHSSSISDLAWSADGRRLASVCYHGELRLWNSDGTPGAVLKPCDADVDGVAWSPDGTRLIATNPHQALQLWKASGVPAPALQNVPEGVSAVSWDPDGARLVVGNYYRPTVWLTDIRGSAGPTLVVHPDSDAPFFVASLAQGSKLAAASHAGIVRVWDARTLQTDWLAFQSELNELALFRSTGPVGTDGSTLKKNFALLFERPDRGIDVLPIERFEEITGRGRTDQAPPGTAGRR